MPSSVELLRTIDVHYAGQSFELSLVMDSPVDGVGIEAIDGRFAAEHERTYGHRAAEDPVEVVHIRVQGRVPADSWARGSKPIASQRESTRDAYFGPQHGMVQTHVVQRVNVGATRRPGPVIVEEYDATTVVPPGWSIRREGLNLLIERSRTA